MTPKIRRNVIHTDAQMKEHSTTCVHRYHNGERKNQCELTGEDCNNMLWSEQTCALTIHINELQKVFGIVK
jgi:hypothetical protein